MTDQEFNKYWREATGFNTMTADWIRSLTPDDFSGKVYQFIRLIGRLSLLYTIFHADGTVMKYGRFQRHIHDDDTKYTVGDYTFEGNASDLTVKLMEIIFNTTSSKVEFLLDDDGQYLVFPDDTKIRVD